MTDKLVELIAKYFKKLNPNSNYIIATQLAGYLRNNGVTLQQWIPVSERLPNDGEDVLLYDKNFAFADIGTYYKCGSRTSRNPKPCFVVIGRRHPIDDYTHWMPIEPPKEGE